VFAGGGEVDGEEAGEVGREGLHAVGAGDGRVHADLDAGGGGAGEGVEGEGVDGVADGGRGGAVEVVFGERVAEVAGGALLGAELGEQVAAAS
jgi:hypothetical protein